VPPATIAARILRVFQPRWAGLGWGGYQLLLLVALVWGCQWALRAVWPFTIDDAGISYAYAKHLAEGYGPVAVVGGPRVEGYSNPLWVFLLVPFHWLGLPLPIVAKALGVACFSVAVAAGAGILALQAERPLRAFGALEIGLALGLAGCLEIVVWVVAGLENSLFCALMLLLAFLDARESQAPERIGSSGLVAFGLCITRPEGAMYAAPLILIKLAQSIRQRMYLRQAVTAALACLIPLLLYHAVHYLVFRQVVPNTYYAKPGNHDFRKGYQYLIVNLTDSAVLYALPLALIGLIRKSRRTLLLGWDCVAGAAFVLYAGGDWMPHGRFVSLFAPAVLVLAALGVSSVGLVLGRVARGRVPRELLSCGLVGVLSWLWWGHQLPRLRQLAQRPWCHFCERLADTRELERIARRAGLASVSLVTHDFGGPSWLSNDRLYPIDFLGLCDRSVALLRHDRVAGSDAGSRAMGNDFRFYQYLIHEQPSPPSLLYLPPNFWPHFDRSPEFSLDYFRLDPRQLPRARRDAYFGLHRAELVDYFPPVHDARFQALTPKFALVGSATFADPAGAPSSLASRVGPASQLLTLVSVVPRGRLDGAEQLKLRIEAGAESVESATVPIARGLDRIANQLEQGQPLGLEFQTQLPAAPTVAYRIRLGVSGSPEKGQAPGAGSSASWEFVDLESLQSGAPLPLFERALPRFPAALPPPIEPELRRLRQPVTMAIEARRRFGELVVPNAELTRSLISLGSELAARDQTAQAYLSYVWATQVDRRAWEGVAETLFPLRQTAMDDEHTMELGLLQQYYAFGTPDALSRVVAFYVSTARLLEAQYFFERLPSSAPDPVRWAALSDALAPPGSNANLPSIRQTPDIFGAFAQDPLGPGDRLDFEGASLEEWEGESQAYLAGVRSDRHGVKGLRGQHGQGILSSLATGPGARGALRSVEFPLRGRMLSLLVGGGTKKSRVGVELIVEESVVKSAYGNDSEFMYPEFWDISEYEGKSGHLRVFDQSSSSFVMLDRVLLWH
jgi:hypothetical protein